MTFRHPLRNEWDAVAEQFARLSVQRNRGGAMARVMMDIMPAFLASLERERDNATSPDIMFDGIASACGMMIENVIEHHPVAPPREALQRMLTNIQRIVLPKVEAKRSKIIMPEGYGG